uniref:Uncharacterized protein n=1 Tax=Panagrolaimus davidi TaxID=227884 RepID=A0A914QEY3_9BILA
MIQILMASERFFAVTRPTNLFTCFHSWIPLFVVACISILIIAIPSAISLIDPIPNVRYGCGRKAAFSTAFGLIDYITNIFGFSFAFGLNLFVLYKAHQLSLSSKQCQKIRAYTVISLISTVLISIPNLCSLINAVAVKLPDLLITPTAIMACINCSLQFFVYLYFSREYRNRVLFLFTFGKLKNGFPRKVQTKTVPCVTVNKNEINNVRDYF